VTRTRAAFALTVATLLGYQLLRTFALPDAIHLTGNLVATGGLFVIARSARVSNEELGVARWRDGLMLGSVAFATISAALVVAAILPVTGGLFEDASAPNGIGSLLFEILVSIPVGTVVLEEFAFRGSLLALIRRDRSTVVAVLASSFLFGLWHVLPSVADGSPGGPEAALVAAGWSSTTPVIVVATIGAGVVFCWLRLRSGSLLAPFLAHVATNSVSTLIAWAVRP
jgi:membrane protease YdiL (CAAX protease family)